MQAKVNERISVQQLDELVGFKGMTDLGAVEIARDSSHTRVSVTDADGHVTLFHLDDRGKVYSNRVNAVLPGEYDGKIPSVEPAAGSVGEVIQAIARSKERTNQ